MCWKLQTKAKIAKLESLVEIITWRANIHDYSFVKAYRFIILQLKVKDDQTYIILFLEIYRRKTRINERIPFKYKSSQIPLGKKCLISRLQAFWRRRRGLR